MSVTFGLVQEMGLWPKQKNFFNTKVLISNLFNDLKKESDFKRVNSKKIGFL